MTTAITIIDGTSYTYQYEKYSVALRMSRADLERELGELLGLVRGSWTHSERATIVAAFWSGTVSPA
jgi:hypothetical protein